MHHFVPVDDGVSSAHRTDPSHAEALRRWTRELLQLPESDVVSVMERTCVDPGCPLVETVVAVFGDGPTRSWTFTRPRVAVTKLMLHQVLKPDGRG